MYSVAAWARLFGRNEIVPSFNERDSIFTRQNRLGWRFLLIFFIRPLTLMTFYIADLISPPWLRPAFLSAFFLGNSKIEANLNYISTNLMKKYIHKNKISLSAVWLNRKPNNWLVEDKKKKKKFKCFVYIFWGWFFDIPCRSSKRTERCGRKCNRRGWHTVN